MSNPITGFVFTATGAFLIWAFKGFKGPFDNEMVSIHESHSIKGTIRFFLGICVWLLIGFIAIEIFSSPTEARIYIVE